MNELLPFYLGFSHCMGIGPITFDQLVEHFGDIPSAYNADKKDLQQVLSANLTEHFCNFRANFSFEKTYAEIQKKQIHILTREDSLYPSNLRNLKDAPICIYVKGNIPNINFERDTCIAIVGTRKATPYGASVTKQFSTQLASAGMVIVSGMAIGIDAIAHKAALDAKGKTIAVLGCGVDLAYPTQNYPLYQRILSEGGLILSEFPPGMMSQRGTFVSRNRLISALSKGTLVVEGAKNSGSLITARCAAEQGTEVFAVPGNIDCELAEGPNMLIREGAQLVTCPEDIFQTLSIDSIKSSRSLQHILESLTTEEREIVLNIQKGVKNIDDLGIITTYSIRIISQYISLLEIKGIIKQGLNGNLELLV